MSQPDSALPSRPAPSLPWLTPALGWASAAVIALGLVLTFLAPPDATMGYLSRNFPLHVPVSWLAYLSFGVTAAYSLAYLATRRPGFDRLAASSAEVGVVFVIGSLFSGAVWGKPAWGVYWQWDPRLTTTALVLAIYIGYLMVRGLIEDASRRARVSAAVGVVAAVGVPINYMSVYWWRGIHQTPSFSLIEGHSYMRGNPELVTAFLVTLVGFNVLYLYLMRLRGRLARLQAEREEQDLDLELAGLAGRRPVAS